MCSCEGSFVCKRCEGTPFSPYYELEEAEPVSEDQFDGLSRERNDGIWQGWV